jgi:hypothetical protein
MLVMGGEGGGEMASAADGKGFGGGGEGWRASEGKRGEGRASERERELKKN